MRARLPACVLSLVFVGVTFCGSTALAPVISQSSAGDVALADRMTSQQVAPGEVTVGIVLQAGRPGLGMLLVTNSGSTPFLVQGWLRLSFTTKEGKPVEMLTEERPVPGDGTAITLKPRQSAFAGVRLVLSSKPALAAIGAIDAHVPGAGTVRVNIIGTDGQPLTDTSRIKAQEVTIGTLQPTSQGVLGGL